MITINESATMFRIAAACMMQVEAMGYRAYWVSMPDRDTIMIDAEHSDAGHSREFVFDGGGRPK